MHIQSPVGFVELLLEELILIAVSIVIVDPVLNDDPKIQIKGLIKLSKHITICPQKINLNNFSKTLKQTY